MELVSGGWENHQILDLIWKNQSGFQLSRCHGDVKTIFSEELPRKPVAATLEGCGADKQGNVVWVDVTALTRGLQLEPSIKVPFGPIDLFELQKAQGDLVIGEILILKESMNTLTNDLLKHERHCKENDA